MKKYLTNWRARHQHPLNLALHGIGIPLTLMGFVLLFCQWWQLAGVLLVGGYLLQFIGHAIEGNDAGEIILLKRLLGLPCRTIVRPRNPKESEAES